MSDRPPVLETALAVDCLGELLIAIAHLPKNPNRIGVLVVVGGPQYRVGSHRQYVLLARHLAEQGIPVFRFDCRGMGDSTGEFRSFLQMNEDIRSAIDAFFEQCPSLQKVCVWGLCDGASAALIYSKDDERIASLILLNPWVRTEQSLAVAHLRTYYWKRMLDKQSWIRMLSSPREFRKRIGEVAQTVRTAIRPRPGMPRSDTESVSNSTTESDPGSAPYPDWMLESLIAFDRPVMFIMSENDITASEFQHLVNGHSGWQKACKSSKNEWHEIQNANHTFSTLDHRNQVATLTANWIHRL